MLQRIQSWSKTQLDHMAKLEFSFFFFLNNLSVGLVDYNVFISWSVSDMVSASGLLPKLVSSCKLRGYFTDRV